MPDAADRPVITKVSPKRISAAGGKVVTITGSGFTGATAAKFGPYDAQALTVISDQEIRAITPPTYPCTVELKVTTPGGVSDPTLVTFVTAQGRTSVFLLEMGYLVILLVIAGLYFTNIKPFKFDFGPVPVGVPWFAALGAVMIGLQGVVDHGVDWDENYNLWHVARPFVGIAFGVVVYLIVVAGIVATGTTPVKTGAAVKPTDNIFYYVMAFVVGYRESIFRSLIKKVADLIFTPGPP